MEAVFSGFELFVLLPPVIGVLLYHVGCYLEYKLGIKDTARVVPVHGVWYVGEVVLVSYLISCSDCHSLLMF